MFRRYKILLVIFSGIISSAYGQSAFEFNGKTVLPGTKEHFTIDISDGDRHTSIPITIFHGKEEGPVLGITAGVHGYEYAPILAGQQLIEAIAPEELRGTVILVQIAGLASFLGRSPYVNPLDGKNLNRSFPGRPNGSVTEKIAYYISGNIIARSDFFLDMHSGDAPEDLMPYTAYYHHDTKLEISKIGRQMATNMGFDHVVVFNTTGKEYMQEESPSLYCSAEAFKRGIPAMDIECGRLGKVEDLSIEKIRIGVMNLLRQLKMMSGRPTLSSTVNIIEERSYINSAETGIFYPSKSAGDQVQKGMALGYLTDFFGRNKKEVYADKDGIILFMLGTPPVSKDETLIVIGVLK